MRGLQQKLMMPNEGDLQETDELEVSQQSTDGPAGKGQYTLCKVGILNSTNKLLSPISTLPPIDDPDPADIPQSCSDIDLNTMYLLVSKEDLEKLWHRDQITISDDLKLYMYWNQWLQYPSHITIPRLSQRGVPPPSIKHIRKVPPCAAYLFTKAQRRDWRTRGTAKIIRMAKHDKSDKGTSTVTMVDHASNFSYSHLIRGTSISETWVVKDTYEIVMHSYGHK
eukprot:7561059-Ditylum_brightwellii.AAC.1